jgi:hypothetical protein
LCLLRGPEASVSDRPDDLARHGRPVPTKPRKDGRVSRVVCDITGYGTEPASESRLLAEVVNAEGPSESLGGESSRGDWEKGKFQRTASGQARERDRTYVGEEGTLRRNVSETSIRMRASQSRWAHRRPARGPRSARTPDASGCCQDGRLFPS